MGVEDVCRGEPEDTTAMPTKAGPVAELAWSEADSETDEPRREPWRTVWGRALLLLAAGAVVATLVVWVHHDSASRRQPPTQVSAAPTAPAVTSSAGPPVVAAPPTVTATPSPPATAPAPTPSDPVREQNFMTALKNAVDLSGPNHISYADIPGSHGAYMGDVTAWLPGGAVVKYGYKACAVLAQYPGDRKRATEVFYGGLGGPTGVDASAERARETYMDIVAIDLCA